MPLRIGRAAGKLVRRDGGRASAHGVNAAVGMPGSRPQYGGIGRQDRVVAVFRDVSQVGQLRALLHGKSHAVPDVLRQGCFFLQVHRAVQQRAA